MISDEDRDREDLDVPRLTLSNWNSQFKERFKIAALSYGVASDILVQEQDIVIRDGRKPEFDMMEYLRDAEGARVRDADGVPVP